MADTVVSATEQEDGSLRVAYASGAVRFVPAREGNRDYEQLNRLVQAGALTVEGASRCGLLPRDVSARAARRARELDDLAARSAEAEAARIAEEQAALAAEAEQRRKAQQAVEVEIVRRVAARVAALERARLAAQRS